MAITFDDTADAGTLQSLQGKVMEMAVSAQATIEKEHTANGVHKNITATGIGSRTGQPLILRSGVVWTGGPQTYVPPAVISPPALTADTHDWTPAGLATAQIIEMTASASVRLTGISVTGTARQQRRDLRLVNRSTVNLTLPSNSPDSLPEHRFAFGGVDFTLTAGTHVDLYYVPAIARWSGVPSAAGGGGGGGAPDPHAPTHSAGSSDPVAVTALAGYPGDPALVLRGNATFTPMPTTPPTAHHATHEPGGTDPLANVAWTNLGNVFTAPQQMPDHTRIEGNNSVLELLSTGSGADLRRWRTVNYGDGTLQLEAHTDAGVLQGALQVTRGSVMQAMGGLGATPLNADNLTTGLVPPARLPPLAAHHASHEPGGSDALVNAAWRDVDNNFVPQTLASQTAIVGAFSVLRFQDPTAAPGARNWRLQNSGDESFMLELQDDALTTATTILEVRRNNGVLNLPFGAIRFGVQPANTDPDTLDAYMERPWTPTLGASGGASGMTYTVNVGSYLKIGQLVSAQFEIQIATLGTVAGDIQVSLPYRNGVHQSFGAMFYAGLASKITGLICIALGGGTAAGLYYDHPTTGTMTALTAAHLASGSILRGTVVYRANE